MGITILRTPSGTQPGEAGAIVSPLTLVYSPFLTFEAYEQLLYNTSQSVPVIIGDDFHALARKWPKHSAERKQVENVTRLGLSKYRRRAISGDGFWAEEDETFPMAMYENLSNSETLVGRRCEGIAPRQRRGLLGTATPKPPWLSVHLSIPWFWPGVLLFLRWWLLQETH
jgi:hypothetical protein